MQPRRGRTCGRSVQENKSGRAALSGMTWVTCMEDWRCTSSKCGNADLERWYVIASQLRQVWACTSMTWRKGNNQLRSDLPRLKAPTSTSSTYSLVPCLRLVQDIHPTLDKPSGPVEQGSHSYSATTSFKELPSRTLTKLKRNIHFKVARTISGPPSVLIHSEEPTNAIATSYVRGSSLRFSCTRARGPPVALQLLRYMCRKDVLGFFRVLQWYCVTPPP